MSERMTPAEMEKAQGYAQEFISDPAWSKAQKLLAVSRALIECREPVTPEREMIIDIEDVTCPCGMVINELFKFCPSCGHPIQWEASR